MEYVEFFSIYLRIGAVVAALQYAGTIFRNRNWPRTGLGWFRGLIVFVSTFSIIVLSWPAWIFINLAGVYLWIFPRKIKVRTRKGRR